MNRSHVIGTPKPRWVLKLQAFVKDVREFVSDWRAGRVIFIIVHGKFCVYESNDKGYVYQMARESLARLHDEAVNG